MEYESNSGIGTRGTVAGTVGTVGKETGGLRNQRKSADYPNYNIIKISQSLGDVIRLNFSLTPVKNTQPALGWKTLKGVNCDIFMLSFWMLNVSLYIFIFWGNEENEGKMLAI